MPNIKKPPNYYVSRNIPVYHVLSTVYLIDIIVHTQKPVIKWLLTYHTIAPWTSPIILFALYNVGGDSGLVVESWLAAATQPLVAHTAVDLK